MKVIIIFSLAALASASLEPLGYRVPGLDGPSDHYLPPDHRGSSPLTPESHYLPTNYQSPPQNVIPNSQYLPSNHAATPPQGPVIVAMPSAQYLPTRQHSSASPHSSSSSSSSSTSLSSHRHVGSAHRTPSPNLATTARYPQDRIASQYLLPSQRPGTFTEAIPSPNYLPPNQYSKEFVNQPSLSGSSAYLTPNKFSGFAGQNQYRPGVYSAPKSMAQTPGQYYPASGFSGYSSDAPVKYEFEYKVNDEFGNDFSHKETRNGDDTRGVYTVLLPDGRKQIVHYTADNDGYKPIITYEESATGREGYQY